MQVNIFSFILFGILAFLLLKKNTPKERLLNVLLLEIIIEICSVRGFFIRFGTSEVSYDLFVHCVGLAYISWFIFRYRVTLSRKATLLAFSYLAIMWVSILAELVFPYQNPIIVASDQDAWDGYIAGTTAKAAAVVLPGRFLSYFFLASNFMLSVVLFKSFFSRNDLQWMLNVIIRFMPWMLILVFGEFITKNILNSDIYVNIMDLIFGTGMSTYEDLEIRGDFYQLQGITREPSALAQTLYWFIIFLLIDMKILNHKKFTWRSGLMFGSIIALWLVSQSFSAYLYIIVIGILGLWYLWRNLKSKSTRIIFLSIVVLFIFGLIIPLIVGSDADSYLGERIQSAMMAYELITSGIFFGDQSSAMARFISIYDAGWDFLQRPLLGLGPGVQYAHGGLVNILNDVGIIGVYFWWRAIISEYSYQKAPILIILVLFNLVNSSAVATSVYVPLVVECFRKYRDSGSVMTSASKARFSDRGVLGNS